MAETDPKAEVDLSHLRAPLETWFSEHWPTCTELTVDRFSTPQASSYSNETVFFIEATREQRRRLVENGLAVLVDLHGIDWRRAGLDWLVPTDESPGLGRQLEIYRRYAHDALKDREHAVLAAAFEWLDRELPAEGETRLSRGDSRPGNMIFADFACVAITDWEGVAIAPAELDLGW